MKRLLWIGALLLCTFVFFPQSPASANEGIDVRALKNGGNLYADDQQTVLEKLPANSFVIVLEKQEVWSKVRINDTVGFVKNAATSAAPYTLMKIGSSNHPIIRQTNAKNAAQLATVSSSAFVFVYTQTDNGFSLIRTAKAVGYVYSTTLVKPASAKMIVSHKNGAAIRLAPNMSEPIQTTLKQQTTVTAYKISADWLYVTSGNLAGYALSSKFATPTAPKPATTKRVALTFDDGPHPTVTNQILKTLAKYDAKATFFMTGRRVDLSPTVLKKVFAAGHEIGNHTYNHPKLTTISSNEARTQITSTNASIKKVIGQEATVFRPPYGAYNDTVKALTSLPVILWSVDTLDWQHHDPAKMLQIVKKQTKNGSIILMHDIHQTTADGLDAVLNYLSDEGYEFVTVSALQEK
ncbi:MAG: polysaccharide deacetylase family protein [Solibacillus sp.]